MSTPRHLRIFLSSPGDMADERSLAIRVIEQLPYDPLLRGKITVEVVAWDKKGAGVPMLATMTPQEAINLGLPKPSECDIVIVIFWSRMGTLLPPDYVKPDGSRYQSGTEWEYLDAVNAARQSKERPARPQVLVYRRTEEVMLKPADPEFMQKYEQWQRVQDFFKGFTDVDGSVRGGYNPYQTPEHFRAELETHLKFLIGRLLEARPIVAPSVQLPPPPEPWPGSPFPGLRAFMPDDAPIFFGRGRETDGLIARLSDPTCRFLCVVGASGSGKSSLVGAGLLPRLIGNAIEGSKDWEWVRLVPRELGRESDPLLALAMTLIKKFPVLERRWARASELAEALTGPEHLDEVVGGALDGKPAWAELLLFIDQFEELFTLVAERYRGPFINLLDRAATTKRLRTVATLRADFYHRCVEWPELAELLRAGSYPLAAPKTGALYEMISRPAVRAGLEFESGLADRILEDTGADPGALALMAYLLDELYRHCETTGSKHLSQAAYESLGGVQGAIGTRAQAVFDVLDKPVQDALPGVFQHLVEVDERGTATRQRAMLNKITGDKTDDAAARLVDTLTKARLLVQSRGDGDWPVVEVAHEALLRSWPRLTQWITEAQEDLILLRQVKTAAEQWEHSGQNKAFLWPHERLVLVYEMIARLKPDLDEVIRDFIMPEFERLLAEIDDPRTTHYRRAAIGDRLAELGDTRPGVGLRPAGVPNIIWCEVPGGSVTLEDNKGTFEVKPCWIAKYPVTYIQYRAFVEAEDGYQDERWWKDLQREGKPGQQNHPTDNHPAENVSWYDAMAFCRWLSVNLGCEVRLPTEWEWRQAATNGDLRNVYPWGREWDSAKANTDESGLSRTTAVGMYPQGAASNGALDVSGNIWEWCLNSHAEPDNEDYRHPERVEPKWETPHNRVVRGGSWYHDLNHARATYRNDYYPDYRLNSVGFRVCAPAPIHPEVLDTDPRAERAAPKEPGFFV